jgi:hypothetical protein
MSDKKFVVIGAGMAGLLAAGILRDRCDTVYEASGWLPNNHHALLRFRSSVVGDTLSIPFKKVTAFKGIATMGHGPIADALAYSKKATGVATLRSIAREVNEPLERYIAPPNLVNQMATKVQCPIEFGKLIDAEGLKELRELGFNVISTIPMPALAGTFGHEFQSTFARRDGFTITADLKGVDAYATIYFPSSFDIFYRASITGNKLIIEYTTGAWALSDIETRKDRELSSALKAFGLDSQCVDKSSVSIQKQSYAKILPIGEEERLRFMIRMTDEYGIYSLGRFATWRPGLLLDDVVSDVHKIIRMADSGINHQRMKGI